MRLLVFSIFGPLGLIALYLAAVADMRERNRNSYHRLARWINSR